jgi:hypothetical protein
MMTKLMKKASGPTNSHLCLCELFVFENMGNLRLRKTRKRKWHETHGRKKGKSEKGKAEREKVVPLLCGGRPSLKY